MGPMGEHGTGTRTQLPNGRWRVAVTMADGRRIWRRAKTEREAIRIQRSLAAARDLELDPTRQTLEGYLRSWIERQRKARNKRIRQRTLDGYDRIIRQHIVPVLGPVTLERLSRRKVQAWVDELDLEPRTVRNVYAVLRMVLGEAAGDLIPTNPALGVRLPPADEYHGHPMTPDEARRFLEATQGTRLAALWRLAIVTGLREGELLGLSRDSLSDGWLSVTAQLQRTAGRWVLEPTKESKTLRLAIDDETARIVRSHLARMAEERQPSWRYFGLMFVTEAGEPYHAKTILKEFHAACDLAGIPRRRVHDLRGTSATILRDLGVAEDTRMSRLGHSTTAMARHYGQASERLDRDAVDRLAEAIG